MQKQVLVLAFLQEFFEEHVATSVPFTDEGGMGWQSQKYESMHLKKMMKHFGMNIHPKRVSDQLNHS